MTGYRPAPEVGWVHTDESTIYVARLPHEAALKLEGTAALIWLQTVPRATFDEVVRHVAEAADTAPEIVRAGTATFLDDLVRRGLLMCEVA